MHYGSAPTCCDCCCHRKKKPRPGRRQRRKPQTSGEDNFDLPVRRAPPSESSFANLLLNIQGENEKIVFTIVHEKAGTRNRAPRPIVGLDARSGPDGCARVVTGLSPVQAGQSPASTPD